MERTSGRGEKAGEFSFVCGLSCHYGLKQGFFTTFSG
jgi:hypothetical protein